MRNVRLDPATLRRLAPSSMSFRGSSSPLDDSLVSIADPLRRLGDHSAKLHSDGARSDHRPPMVGPSPDAVTRWISSVAPIFGGGKALQLKDLLFQQTFSKLFVYNILFEDAEVDERFLGLGDDSRVFSISGAGCGLAGMLSRNPYSIDAVDINPHHLALAALKVQAARQSESYATFYDLFGRGWLPDPRPVIERLTEDLPSWIRRYWARNHAFFSRSLYGEGLTSRLLRELRRRADIDGAWLRSLLDAPVEARRKAIDDAIAPVLESPTARLLAHSPIQLLALGVNFQQSDRLRSSEQMGLAEYFVQHIRRLADTDLRTNWFVWYFVTGQFHHEDPDGVPPYLRRDRFERSQAARTEIRFHRSNVFEALEENGSETWSHYSLLDAPDWMGPHEEERLLQEIRRTGRPGAIVLHRSVGDDTLFGQNPSGRYFEKLEGESSLATKLDRTRQYRHVSLHRLVD